VAAGGFHACGETPEKRTYCWGWNLQGAVGDETKSMRTTPVAVVGGLRFGQVSGGSTHTCARTAAGAAYCWGSYEYGQLGAGEPDDPSNTPDYTRPTAVVGPI